MCRSWVNPVRELLTNMWVVHVSFFYILCRVAKSVFYTSFVRAFYNQLTTTKYALFSLLNNFLYTQSTPLVTTKTNLNIIYIN